MQQVGVSSFKALSQKADVSDWQVKQLRQGKVAQMRAENLLKLSQALQLPITELLTTFSDLNLQSDLNLEIEASAQATKSSDSTEVKQSSSSLGAIADLQQEYQRLQTQLQQQQESLWQEFQRSSLQTLESWLLQWPTAAYAAQQNPQAPAVKLLPLLRPVEQLLQQWGVEAIAAVGTEVPYDPQVHQLMAGMAEAGDPVRVRYTGYRQGDKLLYRAKVSPL